MSVGKVQAFAVVVVWVLCFGWIAGGSVLHVIAVRGLWKQVETTRYVEVEGVIEKSDVRAHRTSKGGTSYTWSVQYRYEYSACGYSSNSVTSSMWSRGNAHDLVRRYPVGARIPIFVNRDEPSESVLFRGVVFGDFVAPAISMALCSGGVFMLRGTLLKKRRQDPEGTIAGLELVEVPPLTGVTLSKLEPLALGGALGALAGAAAILIAGAIGVSSDVGVLGVIVVGWTLTFAIASVAQRWGRRLRISPKKLMIFDAESRMLELPSPDVRGGRRTIRFEDIVAFESLLKSVRGHKGRVVEMPTVELVIAPAERLVITHFSSMERADLFRDWCLGNLKSYQNTNKT